MYWILSYLWVCGCIYVFVCGSVTVITRNYMYPSSPDWVCLKVVTISDQVKVVTNSSWLNFGHCPVPPGRGSAAGRKFLAPPYYSQRAVFASLWARFSLLNVKRQWKPLCVCDICWVLTSEGHCMKQWAELLLTVPWCWRAEHCPCVFTVNCNVFIIHTFVNIHLVLSYHSLWD